MSDFYKCHKCGGTKFCHDVTEVYEEVFDSEEKSVVEGKPYNDGDDWRCKECNAEIPKDDVNEFLSQVLNVSY